MRLTGYPFGRVSLCVNGGRVVYLRRIEPQSRELLLWIEGAPLVETMEAGPLKRQARNNQEHKHHARRQYTAVFKFMRVQDRSGGDTAYCCRHGDENRATTAKANARIACKQFPEGELWCSYTDRTCKSLLSCGTHRLKTAWSQQIPIITACLLIHIK